jgi:membrane protein DedA with SNARE-associated domain
MHGSITGWLAWTIISVLSASGYFGLIGLMAAESACLPLPSEIILPFAGYLVSHGEMNLFAAATAGAMGCNIGSAVAYEVGRHGPRRAIERWGKYILLTHEDLERADRFFDRFGNLAVLIARMLPVVRTFIALPAGIARMPKVRFHLYTFLGSWPWCFLLVYAGLLLGDQWNSSERISAAFHYMDFGILILAGGFFTRFVWKRLRGGRSGDGGCSASS